jgi:hypothetical protein
MFLMPPPGATCQPNLALIFAIDIDRLPSKNRRNVSKIEKNAKPRYDLICPKTGWFPRNPKL